VALGLNRPELRAWAMYDWANSAFVTVIITAIFPIYFMKVANQTVTATNPSVATGRLAIAMAIALTLVAVMAPILGAIADAAPVKKKFLGAFMALGVSSTAAMFMLGPDQWLLASVLFALGNIGAMGSFVFYDSLLPHIASADEIDKVSTAGYALGYFSGGLFLIGAIWVIKNPTTVGLKDTEEATRACFVGVAVWWLIFSIPLFRTVPEPKMPAPFSKSKRALVRDASTGVRETLRELKHYKQAMLFLIAFLIYNDGVGTIMKFAVLYGAELKIDSSDMILAILLVQFIGIPATFAFGTVAGRFTAKSAIYVGLAVYTAVSILGFFMTSSTHFFMLAILVGLVQGGVQALSRSVFASLIPKDKSSKFFGLFAVFEKFAGIFGPGLFALVLMFSDSSRPAILAIIGFFAVGGYLLSRVDIEAGRRQVREEGGE
jgi:UMF1 family MFS transporter